MSTYYRNSKGRVVLATPWSLLEYWQMTHDVDLDDYELTS
jgi:4-hydroxyacetophenone monooxygenase